MSSKGHTVLWRTFFPVLHRLNKTLRKGILDTIWEDHTSLTAQLFDLSGGADTIWTQITAEHQDRRAFKLN